MQAPSKTNISGDFSRFLHGGVRRITLLFGDTLAFYSSLILTLVIRYGAQGFQGEVFYAHRFAFTFGLALWLIVFYSGGLYDKQVIVKTALDKRFFPLVGIGGLLLILLFYFIPSFGITPKTTLVLFVLIYAVVGYSWRMLFNALTKSFLSKGLLRVMLMGSAPVNEELAQELSKNPAHGYVITLWKKEGFHAYADAEAFLADIKQHDIDIVITPQNIERDSAGVHALSLALFGGVSIISFADFYERIFEKVSLAVLDDTWLVRNLSKQRKGLRFFSRFFEGLIALIALIALLPLLVIIALLVRTTSRGPALYRQERVGFNNRTFTLFKFRSMYAEREKNPDADATVAVWAQGSRDPRVTPLGRFLRISHLDELPQLYNILRGDMSFVGPRPERPAFTAELEKTIPYYALRSLVRPGIAGWAQLYYPYGSSTEDAYQKLQYDIYYIKHHSVLLDITILLKTIKRFFVPAQHLSH